MNGGMGSRSWSVPDPEPEYPKYPLSLKIAIQELTVAIESRHGRIADHQAAINDAEKAISATRLEIQQLTWARDNLRDDLRSL